MNKKKVPASFVMQLRRRYRVYFNPQGGYWCVAYRDGCVRQRRTLGVKTRPDAEEAVKLMDEPVHSKPQQRLTWEKFSAAYLAFKAENGLAGGSVKRYRAAIDAFGRHLARLKVTFLDEITLMVLEGYTIYRTKKEGCDVKTAYNDALILKNALKWASKPSRGLLASNPAADWETKEPVKPKRPCYTAEQVSKLESSARPWLRPVVTTLAWTGLRIDELINLRWQDVDFKQRTIHVQIRDDWRPKGKRNRTVPIFPNVEAVLKQQRIGQHVFTGARGGWLKESRVLTCLKEDQVKLGLPENDLHGFRRFFATHMMTKGGVDAETVRQWGGWKSLETMLRYLADVSVTDSVAAMEKAVRRLAAS